MTRRFAATFALLMTLTALLVAPVSAKEAPVGVKLETAIPPDAKPGDKIDVAFTMTVNTPDGETPYNADPLTVRVFGDTEVFVDVLAVRDRPGHYVATITVPEGGIGRIYASIPTDADGPLAWQVYEGRPVVQPAAGAATPEATTAPASEPLAWPIALGIAVAVIAAAAAVVVGRRRTGVGRTSPTRA